MTDGMLIALVAVALLGIAALIYFVFVLPKRQKEDEERRKKRGKPSAGDMESEVDDLLRGKGIRVDPDFSTGQKRGDDGATGPDTDLSATAALKRIGQSGQGSPSNESGPIGF